MSENSEIISSLLKTHLKNLPNVDFLGNPQSLSTSSSDFLGNQYEMNIRLALMFLHPFILAPEQQVESTADVYFQSRKDISDDFDELLLGQKTNSLFDFQMFFKDSLFPPNKISKTQQKKLAQMNPAEEEKRFLYQGEFKSFSNDYKTTLLQSPIEQKPFSKELNPTNQSEVFDEEKKEVNKEIPLICEDVISTSQKKNAKKVRDKAAKQGKSHLEAFETVYKALPDYYLIITNGDPRRFQKEQERKNFLEGVRKTMENNFFEETDLKVIWFFVNLMKVREEAHARTILYQNYKVILNGAIAYKKEKFSVEEKKLRIDKENLLNQKVELLETSTKENIDSNLQLKDLTIKIKEISAEIEKLDAKFNETIEKLKSPLKEEMTKKNDPYYSFHSFCQLINKGFIEEESITGTEMEGLSPAKTIQLAGLYLKWNTN